MWENAKDDDRDAIFHFIRSNPELGRLGSESYYYSDELDFAKSSLYTPLTKHLDLNQSGRILLSGHISRPSIPLSVWPVVLERVNHLFQKNVRRMSCITCWVGPPFVHGIISRILESGSDEKHKV